VAGEMDVELLDHDGKEKGNALYRASWGSSSNLKGGEEVVGEKRRRVLKVLEVCVELLGMS